MTFLTLDERPQPQLPSAFASPLARSITSVISHQRSLGVPFGQADIEVLRVPELIIGIVIRQDGRVVAEHPRSFGRGDTLYDPWHYVPVLARKPGALRNGAPFKDWVLPAAMERVRRKLAGVDNGNRQMVDILSAVLTDGLPAVETACAEAIAHGVHSADVVLNILARQRDPGPPATILTPAALTLRHAPVADCARYDNLRRTI